MPPCIVWLYVCYKCFIVVYREPTSVKLWALLSYYILVFFHNSVFSRLKATPRGCYIPANLFRLLCL